MRGRLRLQQGRCAHAVESMRRLPLHLRGMTPSSARRLRCDRALLPSRLAGICAVAAAVIFIVHTGGGARLRAAEVHVFAAASLTDALKEIAAAYETQSGDRVRFNFGASSQLARQIEEGAPADIFFSADEVKMDMLEKNGRIDSETRTSRLSNTLVIVVAANADRDGPPAIRSAKDLTDARIQRIALADPRAVPAGIYAREYLEKLNLWQAVAPRVVPTENVRAALAAVEAGNVEAGIVYKTDAAISKKVRVAHEIPRNEGPEIRYPTAVVRASRHPEAARRFLENFGSPGATKVFEKHGFIVLRD